MRFANTAFKRQTGQGMTEYIIIVALIAVAAIAVYGFFGQAIRGQVASLAGEVSGNTTAAQAARKDSQTAATDAETQAKSSRGMADYGTPEAKK